MTRFASNERECQAQVQYIIEILENAGEDSENAVVRGILFTDKCRSLPVLDALRDDLKDQITEISPDLLDKIRQRKAGGEDKKQIMELVDDYRESIRMDLRESLSWDAWFRYTVGAAYENHIGATDALIFGSVIGFGAISLGCTGPQALAGAAAAAFTSATQLPLVREFFAGRAC
jgi:hypothetical protein